MDIRPRRLRHNGEIRTLTRETRISASALVLPIFLIEGENVKSPISSLEGHFQYSCDRVKEGIDKALSHGINKFMLFGLPKEKDPVGTQSFHSHGIIQEGIRAIRKIYGDSVYIITDVCMCEYTSHGHCGILDGEYVDNDKTLEYLARIGVSHAEAGADMVAPSDMMDGRVKAMREALDKAGYINVPIMSYSAKYASSFYGPFREAVGSAPAFGDRKAYQMDYHNSREACKEIELDIKEGADIVMVKPAISYLDVISKAKALTNVPLAAYSVSGEYAMIKAAAKAGLINEYGIMCETTISIFRAGADILITYFAEEIADAIAKGHIG